MKSVISLVGLVLFALAGLGTGVSTADAQTVPDDYQQVLKITGKSGDYKANVLKVNIPRNDIHVSIDNLSVPTPFGFGGWFAMTKGDSGDDVMMGDLVLLQEEVNPVMSALLDHGLEVTALHNHFFWETSAHLLHAHSRSRQALGLGGADQARTRPDRQIAPAASVRLPAPRRRPRSIPPASRRSSVTTASRTARFTRSR